MFRITIPLFGKGSVNHLHRPEFILEMHRHGIEVTFLTREDYINIIPRLDACNYISCRLENLSPNIQRFVDVCRQARMLYPADDPGKRERFIEGRVNNSYVPFIMFHTLLNSIARYRLLMKLIVSWEGYCYRNNIIPCIDPSSMDQMVILGFGSAGAEPEGVLSWWARFHKISNVHVVGNYDNLSSKGFRGVPIERLLVWGNSMKEDAIHYHGIPESNIRIIGSIRYATILRRSLPSRNNFFKSINLDLSKKTLLFAGSLFEFHYFEALSILDIMQSEGDSVQMIIRIYPNKTLMDSPYIKPLIEYTKLHKGLYVSIGDPNYHSINKGSDPIYIEEDELWPAIKYCDVVINIFSTIAVEACIFDKPAINMWYFPMGRKGMLHPPKYINFSNSIHNRRLMSYGAIQTATSRSEMISMIRDALKEPAKGKEMREKIVKDECGPLDDHVFERFIDACFEAKKDYTKRV